MQLRLREAAARGWPVFVLAWLVACALAAVMVVATGHGAQDLRMISVFSADEHAAVLRALRNVSELNLDPHGFYYYGYLYPELAVVPLQVASLLGLEVTPRVVAVCMRLLSVASYLAALVLTYLLAKRVLRDRALSSVVVLIVAAMPPMVYWGHVVHPDTLQVALLVAAFWVCSRGQSYQHARVTAVLAGLAFGTKYGGAFLFPFVCLPFLLGTAHRSEHGFARALLAGAGRYLPRLTGYFLLAWLLTNPYVLPNLRSFARCMRNQSALVGRGWHLAEPADPLLWLPRLREVLPPPSLAIVTVGFAASLIVLLVAWRRPGLARRYGIGRRDLLTVGSMVLYCVAMLAYLALEVRMRHAHYFLPIIPFAVVAALWGLARIQRHWPGPVRLLVALSLLAATAPAVLRAAEAVDASLTKEARLDRSVDRELRRRYGPSARIMSDFYVYVSPYFRDVHAVWGDYAANIEKLNPDVLVLTRGIMGRYAWKRAGSRLAEAKLERGRFDHAEREAAFLTAVAAGATPWCIDVERDTFVILHRDATRSR